MNQENTPTVVVIGGSIAGLVAASMLGQHARVIIVEKDAEPVDYVTGRAGTSQDRHVHALLESGHQIMETYFPNFTKTLIKNGARVADRGKDVCWYHFGVYKLRYEDGGKLHLVPRPCIDLTLRECLRNKFASQLDRVTWRFGKRVADLMVNEDSAVQGVRLDDGSTIDCTLVIDASGRDGGTSKLLAKSAFDFVPRRTTLKINITYSTMVFEMPPEYAFTAESFICHASQELQRGSTGMRVNYNTVPGGKPGFNYVLCTQYGYHEDGKFQHATVEDYMRDLETLPQSYFYDMLKQATRSMFPKPIPYMYKEQVKSHWDELQNLPGGFVSVGDASCSFDPTFGQGMSHAALCAFCLAPIAQDLVWGKNTVQARKLVSQQSTVPFLMNAVEDFRYAGTEGERLPLLPLFQTLSGWMYRAQGKCAEVNKKLWRVGHLQDSPLALADPVFWARVYWYGAHA